MKEKVYQTEVLADLKSFLDQLRKTNDLRKAFRQHWLNKKRPVDPDKHQTKLMHPYNNSISPNIPNVTLKVPTAGGKTYIAAKALPLIFDYMSQEQPYVVAWFVPNDAIREQTLLNLSTPGHFYHDALLTSRRPVVVEGKEEALMGTRLSPTEVEENLTILVLSAQSFATNERDDLLSWRQNSAFYQWEGHYHYNTEEKIEGANEMSLIQWLAWQRPVCIVDESHNFGSEMRTEMLRFLNPSFILNLTATPQPESNIISFVDAGKLKKESMVKLPVVLYNMETVNDVIANAILWQKTLERHAIQAQEHGDRYIRPIVLLQVEPRRNGQENANCELVRQTLLDNKIPAGWIKRKLAEPLNELKNINLMAKDCEVRFIITVNALKEGWDCPFAYILAALSNRNSPIDVEQVIGRILRQPHAEASSDPLLNESYVLTSKHDFYAAAEAVIKSLQNCGFSRRDYKMPKKNLTEPKEKEDIKQKPFNGNLFGQEEPGGELNATSDGVAQRLASNQNNSTEMEILANESSEQYQQEAGQNRQNIDIEPMSNEYIMRQEVSNIAREIRIPLFSVENTDKDKYSQSDHIPLTLEMLNSGFRLQDQDTIIDFNDSQTGVTSIDLKDSGDGQFTPKRTSVNKTTLNSLRQTFASYTPEQKKNQLSKAIADKLKYNCIKYNHLIDYINRALGRCESEQMNDVFEAQAKTALTFKKKIDDLLEMYRWKQMKNKLQSREISMNCYWSFPERIYVASAWDSIENSLYVAEEHASPFEEQIMSLIVEQGNVLFWHRNKQNTKHTFTINGFKNHQPDFIVVLDTYDVLLIETKGEHLLNEDSKRKMELGRLWEEYANQNGGDCPRTLI